MKVMNWIMLSLFGFVIIIETVSMRVSNNSIFSLFGMLGPTIPFALMLAYLYKPESKVRHVRAWNINAVMFGLLLIMFFVAGGHYRGESRKDVIAYFVMLIISFALPAGVLLGNLVYLKRKEARQDNGLV